MTGGFVWTDARVRDALDLPSELTREGVAFTEISTDTRTLTRGALFVALEGERFDGHLFLEEAAARGARGMVVSKFRVPGGDVGSATEAGEGPVRYRVEDTLTALGQLARHRRRTLGRTVVGITGSSGKTSVKELVSAALGHSRRVHATRANRNNRVGVPLTLLEAEEETDLWVVELGTSEPGEIGLLTRIAEPDAGVVTTVSEAHLTGLGSLEGVLQEKLDLVRGTASDGPVVVGDRPEILPRRARELREEVHVCGLTDRADPELRGELLEADGEGRYAVRWGGGVWRPAMPGRHGVENFVLALSTARCLGIDDLEGAARAAEQVPPGPLRGEVERLGRLTLLLDCYNANPQSVRAAVDLLLDLPAAGGKVAVLGSMLELGDRASSLHREVLGEVVRRPLDLVVAVGDFAVAAEALATETHSPGSERIAQVLSVPGAGDAYERLRPHLSGSETVLLKASRGVALETLVARFRADFGTSTAAGRRQEA